MTSKIARIAISPVTLVTLVLIPTIPIATLVAAEASGWDSMISNTEESLHSVWGTSSSDVFAVGSGGTIFHFDGEGHELGFLQWEGK